MRGPRPGGFPPARRYSPRGAQTMASPAGPPGPRGMILRARPGGRGAERSGAARGPPAAAQRGSRPGGAPGVPPAPASSSRRAPPPLAPSLRSSWGCRHSVSSLFILLFIFPPWFLFCFFFFLSPLGRTRGSKFAPPRPLSSGAAAQTALRVHHPRGQKHTKG